MLEGKTVIITGAAQGIGAELASGMAVAGAAVAILDVLDGQSVAADILQAGGRALALETDITDDASLCDSVDRITKELGPIDILVNNAALFGTLPPSPMEEISNDLWDQVMRVNVRGVWQCAKAVVPSMESQGGGSIINIATNRIFKGFANMLHYDASKGAVLAMTRAMAAELGDRNIRVNAIAPGLTMSDNVLAKDGIAERNKVIVQGRALGRSQEPRDLLGAVLFFAGPNSDFISGQSLIVDGGGIMM
ncbi:NAD(P)-dependent dehydrogenase, short-chain alcohol dehydrogenase family [Parasphingorhabdus marina DSM 22363]|uniref:NAD(P)-dependent dehydrogenase, short-chain alcohol dehydrogenase family n=1 Tax=Parasphingorhabdus marina DSM 22363 TaxID=1123272 RepID=A0A1N6D404_9SPHN|nr:SDR family oxidoreductase [Parasphingorhabdus marina]SIN65479.1 NAD(P)-dependent dehydrogenase, short-chain alcohol dehydrogenase family [Parasphingorhabdus marina DSM 22363]